MGFNTFKTTLLLAGISGILLGAGYLIGGNTGITIALAFAFLFNIFSYWFSDKIVLKVYRATPATKKEYPKLNKIVDELVQQFDMPRPKVYIIPDQNPNAFATGRNKKHASIAFTLGIIKLLNTEELKGVAAHELSHIKNRDVLISTIVAMIATAISYLAFMARWAAIFGDSDDNDGLELLVLSLLTPILALLIQTSISRTREYLADETAAKVMKNGLPLSNALEKLRDNHTDMRLGNASSAHLFIKNPFRSKAFLSILSTHPPIEKRIKKLRTIV